MSNVTSQETGATREYQGHWVSLLWQSKQARCINCRVRGVSQAGSACVPGFVSNNQTGMSWISTSPPTTMTSPHLTLDRQPIA